MSDTGSVDFEALNHVEEAAFGRGYRGGWEHGAAHGKADGGNLGAQQGFSLWSELGYYEGLAKTWDLILRAGMEEEDEPPASRRQAKQAIQINKFLELIDQFPMENHSSSEPPPPQEPIIDDDSQEEDDDDDEEEEEVPSKEQGPKPDQGPTEEEEPDISQLLARIRAKYRQLARGLGLGTPAYSYAPEEAFAAAASKSDAEAIAPSISALAQAGGVDPAHLRY